MVTYDGFYVFDWTFGGKPMSYNKINECCNNGYEIVGAIRESYIDGVWNKEDESEWLTEIQVPIRKIANQQKI